MRDEALQAHAHAVDPTEHRGGAVRVDTQDACEAGFDRGAIQLAADRRLADEGASLDHAGQRDDARLAH